MAEAANEGSHSGTGSTAGSGRTAADDVRQAFKGLPLDEKVSTLIQVELDMLGDAVSSVVSAVSRAVDEVLGACEPPKQSSSETTAGI